MSLNRCFDIYYFLACIFRYHLFECSVDTESAEYIERERIILNYCKLQFVTAFWRFTIFKFILITELILLGLI